MRDATPRRARGERVRAQASDLKNRAVLFSMDPYVKLTAQPSGATARTKAVKGGGRGPKWKGAGRCALKLAPADARVLVEVWNQNNVTPPDRVGGCQLDLAAVLDDAQALRLPLDTGGELARRPGGRGRRVRGTGSLRRRGCPRG